MKQAILLVVSHVCVLAAGFALGVYALPILTAPTAPTLAETSLAASQSIYKGSLPNAHMRHNEKIACFIDESFTDWMKTPNYSYTADLPYNCSWASSSNL